MSQRSEALQVAIKARRKRMTAIGIDIVNTLRDLLDSAEEGDDERTRGDSALLGLSCRAYRQAACEMAEYVSEVNEIEKKERQAR